MTPELSTYLEEAAARAIDIKERHTPEPDFFAAYDNCNGCESTFPCRTYEAAADIERLTALVRAYDGALEELEESVRRMWDQNDPRGRRPTYMAFLGAIEFACKKAGLEKLP